MTEMTGEDLKNSILQMAMQGKLVEQRPEEGTGEELYQEIQKEKQKLIKEGKIKKEKKLPEITEDEIPFEIPESWVWAKLGDISSYAQPKEKVAPNQIDPEMWSLDLEDIEKETGRVISRVQAKTRKIQGDKVRFHKGNILYSKLRPYLLKILIAEDEGITSPELVPFNVYGDCDQIFILWYLRSPYVDSKVNSVSYGVKMPRVGTDTMINLLVPLPPLAEQKRIVAKIEELMQFVEQYSSASTKLTNLNTSFPDQMKKSILQQAVEGKLVPQDPNDEPASVLLEKIRKEYRRSAPVIPVEDIPFEIPDSWMWVRLIDIVKEKPSNGYSPKGVGYQTPYKNLTLTATTSGVFKPDAFKYVDIPKEKAEKYFLKRNDILIQRSNSRDYVGTSCVYTGDDNAFIYPDLMMRLHLCEGLNTQYVDIVLKSPVTRLYYMKSASGTSESMPKINQAIVSNTLIPIPPKEEQNRISERVRKIIPALESTKMPE